MPTALIKQKQITPKQARGFYYENPPILPTNTQFRQFKLHLFNNTWLPIRKKLHSSSDLQSYLIDHTPKGVYHTISCWLSPHKLVRKGEKTPHSSKWTSNLFLWSDYILDIDNKDHTNLHKALQTLKSLYPTNPFKVLKTGNGYHIHVLDFYKSQKASPFEREQQTLNEMKKLSKTLEKLGIQADYAVSNDTRRIVRVENTLHSNGSIITPYPIAKVNKFIKRTFA